MQSATDTKQPVVTHGFLGTESSSPSTLRPGLLLWLYGERSQVNGQICSPVLGSGLLRSVSQRLLSTIWAGAGAGGAAGAERERRGGGGSRSLRPPRGGAAWILQPRVRARGRATVPRGVRKEHKRNERGLVVVTEVQTSENNLSKDRGGRTDPAPLLLVSSACGHSERK